MDWRVDKTACSMENAVLALAVSDLSSWWMGWCQLGTGCPIWKSGSEKWVDTTVRLRVHA